MVLIIPGGRQGGGDPRRRVLRAIRAHLRPGLDATQLPGHTLNAFDTHTRTHTRTHTHIYTYIYIRVYVFDSLYLFIYSCICLYIYSVLTVLVAGKVGAILGAACFAPTARVYGLACTNKASSLGPYRRPTPRVLGGWAFSHERGTPVGQSSRVPEHSRYGDECSRTFQISEPVM